MVSDNLEKFELNIMLPRFYYIFIWRGELGHTLKSSVLSFGVYTYSTLCIINNCTNVSSSTMLACNSIDSRYTNTAVVLKLHWQLY